MLLLMWIFSCFPIFFSFFCPKEFFPSVRLAASTDFKDGRWGTFVMSSGSAYLDGKSLLGLVFLALVVSPQHDHRLVHLKKGSFGI